MSSSSRAKSSASTPKRRLATLKDGRSLGYDIASLNAGSLIDASLPGARHHALPVKPFDRFLSQLRIAERVAVVGAGAAGAEIAMALRHRGAQVTLYSGAPLQPPALAERLIPQLRKRKVDYRPGMPVTAIEQGPVVIAGAARQGFDLVLLADRRGAIAMAEERGPGAATSTASPWCIPRCRAFRTRRCSRSAIARRCATRRTRSRVFTRCAMASC